MNAGARRQLQAPSHAQCVARERPFHTVHHRLVAEGGSELADGFTTASTNFTLGFRGPWTHKAEALIDFVNTVSFPTEGPVLNLPPASPSTPQTVGSSTTAGSAVTCRLRPLRSRCPPRPPGSSSASQLCCSAAYSLG